MIKKENHPEGWQGWVISHQLRDARDSGNLAGGLRLPIGVDLTLNLDDLARPLVGQSVGQLGLGEVLGNLTLDGFPQFSHSQRSLSQPKLSEHDGLSGFVDCGLSNLYRIAAMNFAVQFVHNLGVVVVVVGQSSVDGIQSSILHRAISFLVFKCFPSLDVFIISWIWEFVKGFRKLFSPIMFAGGQMFLFPCVLSLLTFGNHLDLSV